MFMLILSDYTGSPIGIGRLGLPFGHPVSPSADQPLHGGHFGQP